MIPLRIYLKHWQQLFSGEIGFTFVMLGVILMLYGLVGSMEYADEQKAIAERHQKAHEATEAAFLQCLNGGWVAQTQTAAIVCSKAYEVLKP